MSVLTVIKKIGDRIVSIVEWPFVHAVQTEKLLADGIEDEPEVKAAIVGLVEQFESIGVDTIADVAAKGFDVAEDVKTVEDVRALFAYFTNGFLPVIEKAFNNIKADVDPTPDQAAAPTLSPSVGGVAAA